MFSLNYSGHANSVIDESAIGTTQAGFLKQRFAWQVFSLPLLWILAFTWLIVRSILILSKSRSQLIESLGLIEPVIPDVTVDRLGDNWVSIYWSYPNPNSGNTGSHSGSSSSNSAPLRMRRPKIKKNLIRIGGQTIEAPGEHRRLIITDLKPDTTYKITVQPVYNTLKEATFLLPSSGSKTQGGAVLYGFIYFHTLSSQKDSPPNLNVLLKQPLPDSMLEAPLGVDELAKNKIPCTKAEKILNVQREIQEVFAQYNEAELQVLAKNKSLIAKLSELNAKRRADESLRSQLRAENKALEDDDHALEVKVNKLKLQVAKVERYTADSQQNMMKTTALDDMQSKEKAENDRILDELETRVKNLQTEEAELQESIKETAQAVKTQEVVGEKIRMVIGKLRDSYQASVKDKVAILNSEDAEALKESDKQKLIREIQLDGHIEWEWARAQKSLEQQYVEAYLRNSEHKAQLRIQQSQFRFNQQKQQQQQQQPHPSQPESHPQDHPGSLPSTSPLASLKTPIANTNIMHSLRPNSLSGPNILGTPGIGSPLMQSAMGSSSPQIVHPVSSFTSLNSLGSIPSIQRIPTSTALHPIGSNSFDAFGVTTPSYQGPVNANDSASNSMLSEMTRSALPTEDPVISTSTARDLLPANLFQEAESYEYSPEAHLPASFSAGSPVSHSDTSTSLEDAADTSGVNASRKKKSHGENSSPSHWLSRSSNPSKPHRRTASLFFNSHDEAPEVFSPETASEEEDSVAPDTAGTNRSPLKGMGSRFFQKGGNRSGSFVRRLSIFSRKEAEPLHRDNDSS